MSVSAKKFLVILTIATLGLAGCSKKPMRPDPGSTMMGPGGSTGAHSDSALNPIGVNTGLDGLLADGDSTLQPKGAGYYEEDDQMIKGLLESVYFDFDKSGIKPSERVKLQAAIDYLAANPQHRLLLEGHCDWRGTSEYNLGLGERRAGAARQFLTTAGVVAAKVDTSSKGDIGAIENGDDVSMAKDRRVDLIILKK